MLTKDLDTFICKSYTWVNVPNDTATIRYTCDYIYNSHDYQKYIYMKAFESIRYE